MCRWLIKKILQGQLRREWGGGEGRGKPSGWDFGRGPTPGPVGNSGAKVYFRAFPSSGKGAGFSHSCTLLPQGQPGDLDLQHFYPWQPNTLMLGEGSGCGWGTFSEYWWNHYMVSWTDFLFFFFSPNPSFYLLYFVLPPFEDDGLLFWAPDVFC